jgi:FG-GAP-like repeat
VGSVSVLLNRGRGVFGAARAYRTGFGSRSVAIGDLNGDARPDLATANWGGHSVSVLLNGGNGRFRPRVDYRVGVNPHDIAMGDLNRDGRPDLVTASMKNTSLGGAVSSVSVLINTGDGTFRDRIELRPGRRPVSVAIADLNGDGSPDVATANRSDTVSVFSNRGDGSFRPRVDYRAGSGPYSIAIGDLNGDRRPDLVTANNNTVGGEGGGYVDSVSVLLNGGDTGLRPKVDYGRTKNPELPTLGFGSVAVGDLNGDRKDDVAIGNDANRVCVFVNSGNGRLRPRVDYRTWPTDDGWGPRSVAIGHLNGDRKLDVVSVKFGSVAVLFNRTRA